LDFVCLDGRGKKGDDEIVIRGSRQMKQRLNS